MLLLASSKTAVCLLTSLAPLSVFSRALLNEDCFYDHLEHTQASADLLAAERFTCFTISQSGSTERK